MSDDPAGRNRWYEFEKLDVYRLAVELREVVKAILAKFPQIDSDDADQARRSTKSGIRNVCEGAGEVRPREKARFYRMAARSGSETGGTLRIMESDVGPDPLFNQAHTINYEFIAKLNALAKRMGK